MKKNSVPQKNGFFSSFAADEVSKRLEKFFARSAEIFFSEILMGGDSVCVFADVVVGEKVREEKGERMTNVRVFEK